MLLGDAGITIYFMIDSVTGDVSLKKSLMDDPNLRESYGLQALAYDLGGIHAKNSSNRAEIRVIVKRNKNIPRFEGMPYLKKILQTQSAGPALLSVRAKDTDGQEPFNKVSYEMIGDDTGPSFFQLEDNGEIKLRSGVNLPADKETTYTLRILAKDGGTPPNTATATVRIDVDRNLNSPKFTNDNYKVDVPETLPAGSTVFAVTATDKDTSEPNNVVEYSIAGDDKSPEYFYIHPTNGDITLLQAVRETNTQTYRVRVKASDKGVPPRTATAIVEVKVNRDEGDLKFTQPTYTFSSISENRDVGNNIGNVRATPGNGVKYEVVGTSNAPDYFTVTETSGEVKIKTDLRDDPGKMVFYRLMIRATYQGVRFHEAFAYANITVKRNENQPRFTNGEYRKEILEYFPLGDSITQVTATDKDRDTVIAYRIVEDSVNSDLFFLNPSTGVVTLKKVWPNKEKTEYRFKVEATDQGDPEKTAESRVVVVFRRDKDPRIDNLPREQKVSENADNGDRVYDVNGNDDDRKGNLTWGMIESIPGTDIFRINETSGEIVVMDAAKLKADTAFKYMIPITLYDTARPQKTATATFTAVVTRNEHTPRFTQGEYNVRINDRWALGDEVAVVTATDQDNDTLEFEIRGNDQAKQYYYLNPDTGVITLKKLLTEGTQTNNEIQLRVRDQSVPEKFADSKVKIAIERDQRTPKFKNNPYTANIKEDIEVNRVVDIKPSSIQGQDDDKKGSMRYMLVGDYPAQDFFTIHEETAQVRVKKDLKSDSLRSAKYILKVVTYDSIYPDNQATGTATISVERNPNLPKFPDAAYEKTIDEKLGLGQSVLTVSASDQDKDDISYEMKASGEPAQFFYLNTDTGLITTKKFLTEVKTKEFRFEVIATDSGIPPKKATKAVTVRVIRDEYPPEFEGGPYTAPSVPENKQPGHEVMKVKGKDRDQKGQLRYAIIGDPPSPDYFQINDQSGAITIRKDLMQDYSPYYMLRVTVHDTGNADKSATTTVRIPVTRNVNAPKFAKPMYEATVNENLEVGLSILQVSATDEDKDTITYELTGNPNEVRGIQYFFVTPDTGALHLKKNLMEDGSNSAQYRFPVQARDNRSPERTVESIILIKVNRNKHLPDFQGQPYRMVLSENAKVSESVMTVRARDNDIQGRVQYEIVGDFPAPYFFNIDQNSGQINVKNDLKSDKGFSYKIRVMAYDNIYPEQTSTATVEITMQRNENRPTWSHESTLRLTINETEPLGYLVTNKPNATDADGDKVVYKALGDGEAKRFFHVDADTGMVTIKKMLYPGSRNEYTLEIEASDEGNPERTATMSVYITVRRSTRSPRFDDLPYNVQRIAETMRVGEEVFNVDAHDPDVLLDNNFEKLRFEITGDYPAPSFFSINQDTGVIKLKTNLKSDSLKSTNYRVKVICYDTAYTDQVSTAVVPIQVTRNERAPIFSQPEYRVSITETHRLGSSVIQLSATDDDKDDVSYELIGSQSAKQVFYVNPDSGLVSLKKSLAETVDGTFTLNIEACDDNVPQKCDTAVAYITIIRQHFPPVFQDTPYQVSISEFRESGKSIFKVLASDEDMVGKIVYGTQGLAPAPTYFTLDAETGEITVARDLRQDRRTQYTLRVTAIDDAEPGRMATADITILVQRNANEPKFENDQYRVTVSAKATLGEPFIRVNATDGDGDVIKYTLIGDNTAQSFFYINPTTGEVSLKKSLLDGAASTYTLSIQASDQALPTDQTTTVQVIVTVPRDDKPPRWERTVYNAEIPESKEVGAEVTIVKATDDNRQGEMMYAVTGVYPAQSFFNLTVLSDGRARIRVQKSLRDDSLSLASYTLTLLAWDSEYPEQKISASVIIGVQRNVNGPVFRPSATYSKTIVDSFTVGDMVLQVTAVDQDTEDTIRYQLVEASGNGLDYFLLEEQTGILLLKKPLGNAQSQYQLRVSATDRLGNVGRQTNATIAISITRDEQPPVWKNLPYVIGVVSENAANQSGVYTIKAEDADKKGDIIYEVTGQYPAPQYFAVGRTSGILRVNGNIKADPLRLLTYVLKVQAYDSSNPNQMIYTEIAIPVKRNEFAPTFSKSIYQMDISENYPLGVSIVKVEATDKDLNDTLWYSIVDDDQGKVAARYFWIHPTSGVLIANSDLAKAEGNRFPFSVSARDQSEPEKSASTNVEIILSRDEYPPTIDFAEYNEEITENVRVNTTTVATIIATDRDLKGTMIYEVIGDLAAPSYFGVSFNGNIYVKSSLKDDIATFYSLRVQVYDSANPNQRATTVVNIKVERNVNKPQYSKPNYYAAVVENYPIGASVIQVSATDADEDEIRYKLLSPAEAVQFFYINPLTGEVSVTRPLTESSEKEYVITVMASDGREPENTANSTITVSITRDESRPEFQNTPYNDATVSENLPVGREFYDRIRASDQDLQGTMQYAVIGDMPAPTFFDINTNGRLFVKSNLKLDDEVQYSLRIVAYDSANPNQKATSLVKIEVKRNENGPIFSRNTYNIPASETMALGTFVAQVNATDDDGDAIQYSISGDSSAQQFFFINPVTGRITLKRQLTEDTNTNYNIRVRASDQKTPEKTADATVTVVVRRDQFSPEFNMPNKAFSININHPVMGEVVGVARVNDRDKTGDIMFEMTGVYPAQHFFTIDNKTGSIYVSRSLRDDALQLTLYTLEIKGYDSAYPDNKITEYVTVTVNRNAYAPVFGSSTYAKTVSDNYPLVTNVITVSASDRDGDNVTYQLYDSDSGALEFFFISQDTGVIMLKKSLRDGAASSYRMLIQAHDQGRPVRSADVDVRITVQRNEFPPEFMGAPYVATVSENKQNGTGIFTLRAEDKDLQGRMQYELLGIMPAPEYFRIHPTEGTVWVINDLKSDKTLSYTLRIAAYDSGNPEEKAFTEMMIYIRRNEFGPVFTPKTFQKTILANLGLGTEVALVTASDRDASDKIKYELLGDEMCLEYYYINPDTGGVSLKKLLTSSPITTFNCDVKSNDQGYPEERTDTAKLVISVQRDVQLPTFTQTRYSAEVSESSPVLTSVARVEANVPVVSGSLRYEINGQYPAPDFFSINQDTGIISIKRDLHLDSLQLASYLLLLEAFDSATPNLRGAAQITITVKRNENRPIFVSTSYETKINTTYALGQSIVQVQAEDTDQDTLYYSLIGDEVSQKYFYVDPMTGIVSLKKTITDDTNLQYELLIQASDRTDSEGSQMSTTRVTVTVPRDQNPPRFSGTYQTRLTENAAVNSSVINIRATDVDRKGDMMYDIIGLYPSESFFWINELTGAIYLRNSLKEDSLKSTQYTIRVVAFDSEFPDNLVTSDVTIDVTRNPNAPRFENNRYTSSISESFPVGDIILQVKATDDDGDMVRYQFVGAEDILRYFYLNPDDGSITLRRSLEGISKSGFDFQVRASDQRGDNSKSIETSITISFSRDQEPPEFIGAPYFVQVSENRDVNATVTRLQARDRDLQGQLQFEVRGVAPGSTYFGIKKDTGEIYVLKPLNAESTTTYSLLIVIWDSGSPDMQVQTVVTVTVKRNEFVPTFFPTRYSAEVSEHSAVGTNITKVSASDQDLPGPKSQVTYDIAGDGAGPEYFFIHPSNGDIFIAKALTSDSSKTTLYTLRVLARDQGTPQQTGTATVTVTVDRNRYAPSFLNPDTYRATIAETYTPSLAIMTVSATDQDTQGPNSQVSYSIVGGESALEYFSINPSSGVVTLKKSLVGTQTTRYELSIRASDKGVPPKTVDVTGSIDITTDQNFPEFEQSEYTVEFPENTAVGATIARVRATDQDCAVRYSITGDGLATSLFTIGESTGEVTLKQEFTLDVGTLYVVRVVAYDSCNPVQKTVAFVRVTVIRNENRPEFDESEYEVTIEETQSLGLQILQVNAEDSDPGVSGQVRYLLAAEDSVPNTVDRWFFVNPTTGSLSVITNLRDEPSKRTQYILSIVVQDKGYPPLQDRATVRINVERNLNAPVFEKNVYNITITENRPVNNEVVTVKASDADDDLVTYRVLGTVPAPHFFNVDTSNGRVTVKTALTTGQETKYTLTIQAEDNARPMQSATCQVVITVIRNQHGPVFEKKFYDTTIVEYAQVQSSVMQIVATDKDPVTSRSGQIEFEMQGIEPTPDAAYFFVISSNDGWITVAHPLASDQRKRTKYMLRVTARDRGIPPQEQVTDIEINVLRNQYEPVFSEQIYVSYVDEKLTYGNVILSVSAADSDQQDQPASPNSVITYEIRRNVDSNADNFFGINTKNGNISLIQPLTNDMDKTTLYNLEVLAHDGGDPRKSGSAVVQLHVTRHAISGERVLGFNQPLYLAYLPEGVSDGYEVVMLDVINQDVDKRVECFFVQGNQAGKFALKPVTDGKDCMLVTNGEIDREQQTKYNLTISVRYQNSRVKRQAAAVNLIQIVIFVDDVNDNAPRFIYPSVADKVMEVYFGAVSDQSDPFTTILKVQATDSDQGDFALINFGISKPDPAVPFNIHSESGEVFSTKMFDLDSPPQYKFEVFAENSPLVQRATAQVYVNLIYNENRMVLVIQNKSPAQLNQLRGEIAAALQSQTGYPVLIEKMQPRVFQGGDNEGNVGTTGTDIWFVAINMTSHSLLPRASVAGAFMANGSMSQIRDAFEKSGVAKVAEIRAPLAQTGQVRMDTRGIYVDGPWLALIAMAGIIILFCIVGMIVICFTWGRYKRYTNNYQQNFIYGAKYHNDPVFVEPPSFLKEYETQSLAMYVPPDEPVQEMGEINMNFHSDDGHLPHSGQVIMRQHPPVSHQMASARYEEGGVIAAVNPIYQTTDFGSNRGGQVSLQGGHHGRQGMNGIGRPVEIPQNVQHVDPHLPPDYDDDSYPENTTIL
jgi:protocadherin Fat 4